MCGIVGIWARDANADRFRAELDAAVRSLRHRGPDDCGVWFDSSGVALGHTRLSIIDLSSFGHQPMVSPDGHCVIAFNGEIYNFAEIRARLELAGHSFTGSSDTEVILHAFREWGQNAVKQFLGMFAIALWDEQEGTLDLVRDRIGVKPLYFGWHDGTLCFGSELKALRAFRHWTPEIDRQALAEFLQYGYIAGDRTIYKDVFKLKPGHRLRLKQGGSPVIEPYWSILEAIGEPLQGRDADIEAQLEALLVSACTYRMISDVPVGVFLSGGVDSSLVTAILSRHHDQSVRTFTIGFREDSHDESVWARRVAAHCRTDHTEYILETSEAREIIKDWGSLFDEPFGDSSGIPTLLVSRLASDKVKVVLSADGGDELFSGYNSYTSVLNRTATLERIPGLVRRAAAATMPPSLVPWLDTVASRLPVTARARGAMLRKIRRLSAMFREPTIGRMMDLEMSHWHPAQIEALLGNYAAVRPSADSYPGQAADRISLWDFHHYLPEDIMTKVDRTTMAVSIEGREPLLDHRLAEFAFRMPLNLRRGVLGPKHALKNILYRYVPRSLVDRPKRGFSIPLEAWLRGDLRELVNDLLSTERTRNAGVLDPAMVQRSVRDFQSGDGHLTYPLWFLLAFEMWREKWM